MNLPRSKRIFSYYYSPNLKSFCYNMYIMITVCLVTTMLKQLKPRVYPQAWEQFCQNLKNYGIELISCPSDTRDHKTNEFIYNSLHCRPDIVWQRSVHEVSWEFVSLGSTLFVEYCSDKRKTYQTLLPYHPITFLGSEYFFTDLMKRVPCKTKVWAA